MSGGYVEGFCPDYCSHAPCPHRAGRACGTCGGALSGPSAPHPRCVPCGHWEDECSCIETWRYEPGEHQDHGGADVLHHIVCGDRHVAEVATENDALLIVRAVNTLRLSDNSSSPGLRGES